MTGGRRSSSRRRGSFAGIAPSFRRQWAYPHRRPGRPALPQERVGLLVRLARENPRWGLPADGWRAEEVRRRRLQGQRRRCAAPPSALAGATALGPPWSEFLRSPAKGILAIDERHQRGERPLMPPARTRGSGRPAGRAAAPRRTVTLKRRPGRADSIGSKPSTASVAPGTRCPIPWWGR